MHVKTVSPPQEPRLAPRWGTTCVAFALSALLGGKGVGDHSEGTLQHRDPGRDIQIDATLKPSSPDRLLDELLQATLGDLLKSHDFLGTLVVAFPLSELFG